MRDTLSRRRASFGTFRPPGRMSTVENQSLFRNAMPSPQSAECGSGTTGRGFVRGVRVDRRCETARSSMFEVAIQDRRGPFSTGRQRGATYIFLSRSMRATGRHAALPARTTMPDMTAARWIDFPNRTPSMTANPTATDAAPNVAVVGKLPAAAASRTSGGQITLSGHVLLAEDCVDNRQIISLVSCAGQGPKSCWPKTGASRSTWSTLGRST